MKKALLLGLAALWLGAGTGWASAVLTTPSLAGVPTDLLTFQGYLENTWGQDVYLTGATVSLAGFDPADIDASWFLVGAPLQLTDGDSTATFDWFTVAIPAGFATGVYAGEFAVLGGASEGDDGVIETVPFEVTVRDDTGGSEVPEPGTLGLVGVFGLWLVGRGIRARRN
jgi:hypothetical protein